MKLKLTAPVLVAWLAASFAIPAMLRLKINDRWILTATLALIGIMVAAVLLWWENRKPTAPAKSPEAIDDKDELAQSLSEAKAKLLASAKRVHLNNLPVVFVLGPAGTAKTTTVIQASLEPELLAGQVYADDGVIPTRLVNLWFARQSLLVEPAAAVLGNEERWSSLIRRLEPGKLGAVFASVQPSRSAVVVVDCERLYSSGANSGLSTTARELQAQLSVVSRQFGIALPVYVLFTKADRIPFFQDYVATFDEAEAAQLLGASLPPRKDAATGSYEEAQTASINEAFDGLYHSLAEKRLVYLARETNGVRAASGYEFPRELRRLRPALTQFLVDLCRPSQLSVNPFLRGFYFVGVRPLIVREAVAQPQARVRQAPAPDVGATAIFRPGQFEAPQPLERQELISRRVPQWVFLRRFFSDVVLNDNAARRQSGASQKTASFRRLLLLAATLISAVILVGITVSFAHNRGLQAQVQTAAADVAAAPLETGGVPSVDSLHKLDHLRIALETISHYNRDGAPWSYRWGLYIGDSLLPRARRIYFARFRQLLFGDTQEHLTSGLKSLPLAPGPTDNYSDAYNALKSYLITTSHHEKSTATFLSPELMRYWRGNREIDADRLALARKQFDFYSRELRFENPYTSDNDGALIASARHYLGQFAGTERVYRNMLTEVGKTHPALHFTGSQGVVTDSYEIPGAFTRRAFTDTTDAIKHVNRYFAGEPWVLDTESLSIGNLAKLESDIQAHYTADYIGEWRKYLNAGQVNRYESIQDAARKLSINATPQSPLLGMLCLASENTDANPTVSKAFAPLHKVVPPACSSAYISGANADYMKNLGGLQVALEQIGTQKLDASDPLVTAAASTATQAKTSVIQLAQSLGIDSEGHTEAKIQALLEAPIKNTDALLKSLAPAAINGKGAGLCAEMRPVSLKFPFNLRATDEASLAEINAIFKPGDGSFWKFYEANLSKSLTRTGETIPGGGFAYSPRFLAFFRRAASFSNALYNDSPDPRLEFTLRSVPSTDIQSLRLNIDGTTADFAGASADAHKFFWPGSAHVVSLSGVSKSTGSFTRPYEGLWAVFRFFADANSAPANGVGVYEWDQKFGLAARTVQVVKLDLNMGATPPVFAKGYFSGLSCVAEVASSK